MKRLLMILLLFSFVASTTPAMAGDWLVRVRGISVDPDSDSSTLRSNGASLPDTGVSVDDDVVPELDITYMFRPKLGLELILATSQHDVLAEGSLSSLGKVVDARVLPPTLTLQYHFNPEGTFRPYIGAGLNFTLFYDEETTSGFDTVAGGASSVDLDESVGLAGQFGFDIGINESWFVNFDVKYIQIDTTATITTPGGLGTVEVDVDINPFVYGMGIGRRF